MTKRISKEEANFAQVVIAGYADTNQYKVQLQLKKKDSNGYARDDQNLYEGLSGQITKAEALNILNEFSEKTHLESKVIFDQEIISYQVSLKDAINKSQK